jgi:hypothetical protein
MSQMNTGGGTWWQRQSSRMQPELLFDVYRGVRQASLGSLQKIPLGTHHRDSSGIWKVLTFDPKSRTRERVWRYIPVDKLPKQIKVQMLLLGVT